MKHRFLVSKFGSVFSLAMPRAGAMFAAFSKMHDSQLSTRELYDRFVIPTYGRFDLRLARGRGCEVWDEAGKRYLDFGAGIAVTSIGHAHPRVIRAMQEQIATLVHTSNLYYTRPQGLLAERLVRLVGSPGKVFFCNSGAEANEAAFKFARRWARRAGDDGRHAIIALRGAFHGRLFASLAATDRPEYRAPFTPLAGGIAIHERDTDELERALATGTVAAVIAEPVQGEGGVRVLDPGFLAALRALTSRHGAALIFDEVQCGLGRTGYLFAHERAGVTPDLMTLAKPLAGGLPMGAVLMTKEIASAIRPGDHGSTFGGGPVVSSVARHVLDRVSDPALLKHVREGGEWLGGELRAHAERTGRVRAVRGAGFMWGLDVMEPAAAVVARARERGLLLCGAGEYTLRLLPPLVAQRADLARGLARLEEALA